LGARALATRRHSLLRLRPMCPPFCPSMSVPDLWRPSSLRKGPPTFWHQGHMASFACQEKRGPELRRAFLLPMRSLVKCIPERPMHAGVIVMASRGIPRHPARAGLHDPVRCGVGPALDADPEVERPRLGRG